MQPSLSFVLLFFFSEILSFLMKMYQINMNRVSSIWLTFSSECSGHAFLHHSIINLQLLVLVMKFILNRYLLLFFWQSPESLI